ncbi:wings apart-like protein regulation of heterochromatin-domain-containing protein [Aspergillus heterothallicus]
MRNEETLSSTISMFQRSTDVICSSQADVVKVDSPRRTPSDWRFVQAQKGSPQPPTAQGMGNLGIADMQHNINIVSPRKRLIDSLGITDNTIRSSRTDATPESTDSQEDSPDGRFPASFPDNDGPRTRPGNDIKPRVRTLGRSQTSPTRSLSTMMRSSRVTYSRQRSFLNDLIDGNGDERRSMGKKSDFDPNSEVLGLPSSWVPSESDDISHTKKAVRSIHELRQSGDNARFREVVDSIFEDIEDQHNSISGRCCSIVDLCNKLFDTKFAHRFSEQGFDERLVNCITINSNIVWVSLAFSTLQILTVGGQASRVFIESLWVKIVDQTPLLLDVEDDLLVLAREPSRGLSKTAQVAVRGLRSRLLPVITAPSPRLSPQFLALECMKATLSSLRETGHTVRFAPTPLLETLLNLLLINTPADPSHEDDLYVSRQIFSILENYSIVTGPFDDHQYHCLQRLSRLHGLFTLDMRDQTRSTLLSYVRVILNLTNKEPTLCDDFSIPEIVSGLVRIVIGEFSHVSTQFVPSEIDALHAVILALGTLINLAEETEKARAMLVRSYDSVAPLQQLLEHFCDSANSMDQAHSVPEVHGNVVAGYLSILLLIICLDTDARLFIKQSLNGEGLAVVFSTAEKFLQYHREVEKDTGNAEAYETESKPTERLEHIINRARLLEEVSDELL